MKGLAIAGVAAVIAAAAVGPVALAQSTSPQNGSAKCQEPKGFNYKICNGRRVPKGNAVTSADGSSREVIRQGRCITIKETSPSGEYKETRRCD